MERRKHLTTNPVSGLYILKNGEKCGIMNEALIGVQIRIYRVDETQRETEKI